jgi:HlyD family secretion protein
MSGRRRWIVGILALLAIGGAILFALRRGADAQYLTATAEPRDIRDVVEATGTINAVRTIQVGSQVSGTIAKLYVDFNSTVHAGEVIAKIDPALFQGALDQAQANLHLAQSQLKKDQAVLAYTKVNYGRDQTLAGQNSIALDTVDNAKSAYEQAQAQVGLDQAAIRQNEAAVAIAKTNLAYTTIRSPVDGVVVARSVDVGQTVAASFQAPTIFTIAQDPTKMQVYVNTDESEIGRIHLGRHVTFKVDAYPKETFEGTVREIRMNATTIQNVVTYNTIIDFSNGDQKLFPSMTAYVTIPVASVENVLSIPNTALRFEPPLTPGEIQRLYARHRVFPLIDSTLSDPLARKPGTDEVIVWKLAAKNDLEPVRIVLGITDHAYTQVLKVSAGSLVPGDAVVTAYVAPKATATPAAPR